MKKYILKNRLPLIGMTVLLGYFLSIGTLFSFSDNTQSVPSVGKSDYTVTVDKNVMVPMRDGTKLAADIYRPAKVGSYPVILVRTPYNPCYTGEDM